MYYRALIAFLAAALLGSQAWAQPLVEVESQEILVNCGSGWQRVTGTTPVQPGCRVMARGETGHGWVLYSDCDVEVLPNGFITVRQDPGPDDPKSFRPICKKGPPLWPIAAAGLAVGICAAADCFDDDDPGPASP